MLKKIFLSVAITALLFTGCDSDSSTEPSSSTKGSVKRALEQDRQTLNADAEDCVVKKLSDNSFAMTYSEDGVSVKVTTTVANNFVENEYQATYGASVPMSYVQSLCEENEQEAASKNATVTCSGRTMTIKEIESTDMTFAESFQSAKDACNDINGTYPSDSIESQISQTDGRAICSYRESDNSFAMTALDQDTLMFSVSAEYFDSHYSFDIVMEFMPSVPLSDVQEACDDMKEEYRDAMVNVDCNDRRITIASSSQIDENPIPYIADEMIDFCREIERTGAFPD